MISLNIGIGFTSNMILNNSKWKEKFNKYSLKENNFERDFAIVFKKGKKLNNVEKEFINIIQEKFKSF